MLHLLPTSSFFCLLCIFKNCLYWQIDTCDSSHQKEKWNVGWLIELSLCHWLYKMIQWIFFVNYPHLVSEWFWCWRARYLFPEWPPQQMSLLFRLRTKIGELRSIHAQKITFKNESLNVGRKCCEHMWLQLASRKFWILNNMVQGRFSNISAIGQCKKVRKL